MTRTSARLVTAVVCALLAGTAARAADTTYERLLNPDKEPQNWLMVHRDFAAQRFSPLDTINRSNVKNLRLLFAIALGGSAGNEALEATPLVEDGFMYVIDGWGVVYKIDVRDGKAGRIVWKMDPGQEKAGRHRGVTLWNNLVISATGKDGRIIATDKDSGKIVWDKNLNDQPELELNTAPIPLKDSLIVGSSGGDQGVRNWVASLDARTGNLLWKTYSIPAPGEPGSETWKDRNNAWQTGGGAFYVTGSYDPDTNIALAIDSATGKIRWYHQYTPNDTMDYDESGSHILIDTKVNGEDRKLV